jgi:hypothetical protein
MNSKLSARIRLSIRARLNEIAVNCHPDSNYRLGMDVRLEGLVIEWNRR